VPTALSENLDLLYGRASTAVILALVQDGQWAEARRLIYTLRELLLSDVMLSDLAEQKGAAAAKDVKGLFEAMVHAFRKAEPEAAAEIDAQITERKGGPVEEPERAARGRVEARSTSRR
jgi:hypothetical protein